MTIGAGLRAVGSEIADVAAEVADEATQGRVELVVVVGGPVADELVAGQSAPLQSAFVAAAEHKIVPVLG